MAAATERLGVAPAGGARSTIIRIAGQALAGASAILRIAADASADFHLTSSIADGGKLAEEVAIRSPTFIGATTVRAGCSFGRLRQHLLALPTILLAAFISLAATGAGHAAGAAPDVTSITPSSGPTGGGTSVTITGDNFDNGTNTVTAVSFGGSAALSFSIGSDNTVTAVSPHGSVGTDDVTVTTNGSNGGTSGTNPADVFTYIGAPTVTGISPSKGPTSGGTSVVITGTNFIDGATIVYFGTASATISVNSSTQITATSPAEGSGTVDITVVTDSGTSATSTADQFSYYTTPTVTSVTPTDGPAVGGTSVTIVGTGFTDATTVKFGSTAVSSFTIVSDTVITTTSPGGSPGIVDITVTTPGGTSSTSSADQFTYIGAPVVTSISPTSGPASGNTIVTITGSGFTGATKVNFGTGTNSVASYVVNSDTSITARAPPGTGIVDVTVTTAGGTSATSSADQYTYSPTPMVTSLSTSSGPFSGGTPLTITGSGFFGGGSSSAVTKVDFGNNAATSVTVISDTSITATSPAGTGTVSVTVTTSGGGTSPSSAGSEFNYTGTTVTLISPASGTTAGGTPVTITGSGFTGVTSVKFGTKNAVSYSVTNSTSIMATSPAGSGTVDITVTTSGGGTSPNSAADQFTYTNGTPTASGISPTSGPAGTSVKITGTNFTGQITVTFGSTPATLFSVNSSTSITATAPPGTGSVAVTVTTPGGTVNAGTFTYSSLPTVTSVSTTPSTSPTSGPAAGNTLVTITGTNFTGATAVSFGGSSAASFTINSATSITAVTPAGSGTVAVSVTTPQGTGTLNSAFTYTAAPIVTMISPTGGLPTGGTSVIITGFNFSGANAVKFGSTAVLVGNFTVNSATSITATAPAGTGTVDVTVTTAQGPSAISSADQFTYTTLPVVSSISPTSGPTAGGTHVTISGNNFGGATAVYFGTTPGTSIVVNATSISVNSPAGTGVVDVTVTTAGGTSTKVAADQFTYIPPKPTVTSIVNNNGPITGGTSVTINGTGFYNGGASGAVIAVKFGSNAANDTVVSDTQITATSPPGAAGAVDITVTTPAGTSATSAADKFTYNSSAVTVTSVTPNVGPSGGGVTVTITGANFSGVTAVKFGTSAAASYTVNSTTQISATTPSGTTGTTVDVVVTASAGTSATSSADQYTYTSAAAVTAISPSTGPATGGTVVTITGSNFTGATAVNFGGKAATSFTVNSATSITATAPAGTGIVHVTVVTPSGTSATSPLDQFTFTSGGKTATSLALTSSPNPSVHGQPVTFRAVVTGNAPTGAVTFLNGSQQIGTATLSSTTATTSTAVFTIASLPVGSDAITAKYPGDANNAADPETITQVVNAPADSVKLHELQLAVMNVETNVSAQAITGAIDSAIGAGFSGVCSAAPTPNGSGFTYCFDGSPQAQTGPPTAPQQARAKIDDDFAALGYAEGLPGTRWAAPQDIRTAGDLTSPPAAAPTVVPYKPPQPWLAWFDVRGSEIDRTSSTSDLKGLQVNAMAGVTRRLTLNFLVGVTGGYENFDYSSEAYNGVLRGQGFTTGAYLGWRFFRNMRFEAAGTWSDIFASGYAGTASGSFTGTRWLAFGNLTGTFNFRGVAIEPSTQVYTLWEHENSYTDSLGTLQDSHDFDTGRASSGVKFSHPFVVGAGNLTPYAGLYADYYFTMDSESASEIASVAPVPFLQGWAARATGGLTATFHNGAQVTVGGELSGLGNDTQIWTVNVRSSVPF